MDQDKELIAVIDLVVDAIEDGVAVMADGKIGIDDLAKLSNLLPDLIPAMAGMNAVPAELKAMTFDEASTIVLHVVAKLNITSTRAVGIVQAAVKCAASVYELVLAIKAPAA